MTLTEAQKLLLFQILSESLRISDCEDCPFSFSKSARSELWDAILAQQGKDECVVCVHCSESWNKKTP